MAAGWWHSIDSPTNGLVDATVTFTISTMISTTGACTECDLSWLEEVSAFNYARAPYFGEAFERALSLAEQRARRSLELRRRMSFETRWRRHDRVRPQLPVGFNPIAPLPRNNC